MNAEDWKRLIGTSDIFPTHTCFDDSLDFIEQQIKVDKRTVHRMILVHAICLYPETHGLAGQRYAHAWVELDGLCWDCGIANGVRIYYAATREEFDKQLRPQETTRYNMREVMRLNHLHGTYGPWEKKYLDLCAERGTEHHDRF